MADLSMTMHAPHSIFMRRTSPDDVVHEIRVIAHAVRLQRRGAAFNHLDRFMEVHEREALRMPVAVVGLGQVFPNEIVRQVAIHTSGHGMMRAMGPGGELVVHHVAVLARAGVGRKVAQSLAVAERERTEPDDHSHQGGHNNGKRRVPRDRGVRPQRWKIKSQR